jgi:hypothetical protein
MQEIPESQQAQASTQQQCHPPIVKIQKSTKTNKVPNGTKQAKWTYQHLKRCHGRNGEGTHFFAKGSQVLEHSNYKYIHKYKSHRNYNQCFVFHVFVSKKY